MHELSIARNIVAIVSEAAQGRKVLRVTLDIGRLSGIEADAVAFCFPLVAAGSPAADAELEIHQIAARGRCAHCAAEFDMAALGSPCVCGSRQITRLSGDELKIRTVELEGVSIAPSPA